MISLFLSADFFSRSFVGNSFFSRGDDADLRVFKAKYTYYLLAKVFTIENV